MCSADVETYTNLIKRKKMEDLKIFDENGKALHITDVISRFTKFKKYGTKTDGAIFYIDEDKLNKDHINQIRNYLNSREKKLKGGK